MKVVAGGGKTAQQGREILEPAREHVHDTPFPLHFTVYGEQARSQQLLSLPFGEVVPDDQVHVPGLVLERHEDHAARGGGPLPASDEARGIDDLAVSALRDFGRRVDAALLQSLAKERERMACVCQGNADGPGVRPSVA